MRRATLLALLALAACRTPSVYPYESSDHWVHDSAHAKHLRDDGKGGWWIDVHDTVLVPGGLASVHFDFFCPDPPSGGSAR